jgi:S-adenosylmethionine:tRNA ribosyltransferase-isomerase
MVPLEPYTYELPDDRIAQRPVHPPDSARLLVIDRESKSLSDHTFRDLPELLQQSSHFVFNDTRVIPARLFGTLEPSGAQVELLLAKQVAPYGTEAFPTWECLGRPLKRIRKAQSIRFGSNLVATVVDSSDSDSVTVQFSSPEGVDVQQELTQQGSMPIPPYIRGGHGDSQDLDDYQTIFAQRPGSVAAPTASLHFTPGLVSDIRSKGCPVSFITLHVGTASFQPVLVDGVLKSPATESLQVSESTLLELKRSKASGTPIVGVGTTVVRALESAYGDTPVVSNGETALFITPGYTFRCIDHLITNFHQPGTTHLLLVEALLGRELLNAAYSHALERGYRFLSYGDGMLIR